MKAITRAQAMQRCWQLEHDNSALRRALNIVSGRIEHCNPLGPSQIVRIDADHVYRLILIDPASPTGGYILVTYYAPGQEPYTIVKLFDDYKAEWQRDFTSREAPLFHDALGKLAVERQRIVDRSGGNNAGAV